MQAADGNRTRSRTPSSSTTNFTKLKADVDALISSLNNFSSKHTGFANFKKEIDGVEVSLDSLIKGLNEVGNSKDLAELRSQATALRTAFNGIRVLKMFLSPESILFRIESKNL